MPLRLTAAQEGISGSCSNREAVVAGLPSSTRPISSQPIFSSASGPGSLPTVTTVLCRGPRAVRTGSPNAHDSYCIPPLFRQRLRKYIVPKLLQFNALFSRGESALHALLCHRFLDLQ